MIAEIRLENFKRFRDLTLNTANLTVLTGANGAGKTSILHSLLLARQIARQPGRNYVELNGVDTLELGGPEDVIHREASDDLAAVEVLDTEGTRRRWSFRATSTTDTRTLNATVVDRPDDYRGALAESAPQFSYLCAERLGPRDVLSASAADVAELDVGSRGEFVAQVLASFDRSRISTGRLESSTADTQISSLLHQTESWMGKIVHPIQIDAEWFPNTSVTRLRFKTPGIRTEWTRAPNAGFGISYALPIVVAALRAEVGGLLLVENPEAPFAPGWSVKDRRLSGAGCGGWCADLSRDSQRSRTERHPGSGRRRQCRACPGAGCDPLLPGRRRWRSCPAIDGAAANWPAHRLAHRVF